TQQCSQVVVNYQDRLVRFGFELIEDICQENDVEITVINQTKAESSNEELVDDVLSVISVYSAKLYGKRSHHNEKIIKTNQELFKDR
ncbi:recombinase family protein, partial [Lactobacillus kefiranofaciens]